MSETEGMDFRSSLSSVEVSQNAKGEFAFKVKVYEGTEQEELDGMVGKAAETLKALVNSVM